MITVISDGSSDPEYCSSISHCQCDWSFPCMWTLWCFIVFSWKLLSRHLKGWKYKEKLKDTLERYSWKVERHSWKEWLNESLLKVFHLSLLKVSLENHSWKSFKVTLESHSWKSHLNSHSCLDTLERHSWKVERHLSRYQKCLV